MNWIKHGYRIFAVACISVIAALGVYIRESGISGEHEVHLTFEEREWIDAHDGEIRIGADIDYIPMDFINKWGEHDGIAEDYFKLIERKLDIRFKRIRTGSWKELLEKARQGDIDIVKCLVKSPERSEYLQFTRSYLDLPSVIVTSSGSRGDSLKLEDLAGKTAAVNDGYYIHEIVRNNYPQIRLIPVKNNKQLFELVSTGGADYALTDLPTVTYYVRKFGVAGLRIAGETGYDNRLAAGGRKDLDILNRILSKAIDSISEQEKNDITAKWISVEYNRYLYSKRVFIAIITGFAAVISVIFIIIVWNKSLHVLVQKKTDELEKYKDSLEELVDDRTRQLRESNHDLADALANVKTLTGLLPICANCKKIRNDKGYWEQIENYVSEHTGADFSHSICPECAEKLYPGLNSKK